MANLYWIVILSLVCVNLPAVAQEKVHQESVLVTFEDRLLTVAAEGVPLSVVLERIAEVANVSIQLQGAADVPVNIRPVPRTIEKTVIRLAEGINAVFLYGSANGGGDRPTDIFLVSLGVDRSIKVFGPMDKTGGVFSLAHGALFEKIVSIEPHQLADATDIDKLIHILRFDADPASRATAAEFLANVTFERYPLVAEVLTLALQDSNAAVRFAALESLTTVQTTDHADAMALALRDDDPQVRLGVVLAIGSMEQSEGMALAERVLKEGDATARVEVVEVLSQVENPDAEYLLWLAGYDEDPAVRNAASKAYNQKESTDN